MATRRPLVFVAGEIVESSSEDTIDITNINITNLLRDFVINVKDFGAKGDGTTDDIQAFRDALAEATAKNTVVYIPYGSYNLSEDITGKFITFGHVIFSGSGSAFPLTDVYNDFVHKNFNITEIVTGNKTFTGITDITTGDIHTRKLSGTTVNAPNGVCNLASGTVFFVDATTANKTISFNTAPVGNISIGILIDKGEDQTITWPSNVKWAQGYDLKLVTGKNFIKLYSPDSGNSWYGVSVTQPLNIEQFLESIIQKTVEKVLEEITQLIDIKIKRPGGIEKDDDGIYCNLKPDGGLAIDENNQLYVIFPPCDCCKCEEENKVPTVESGTHTIGEDSNAYTVSGNALTNAKLGDGTAEEHEFQWDTNAAEYGTMTRNPNGQYTYVLNNDDARVQALNEGETLTETFGFTYSDKDGDQAQGAITITITGTKENIPLIEGGAGNDWLFGTTGDDSMFGYGEGDGIEGKEGNDYLDGGPGDDNLYGGPGNDTLVGGEGIDTFYFALGDGHDLIMDGEDADIIIFKDGVTLNDLSANIAGNDLIINVGTSGNDSITIKDWVTKPNKLTYFRLWNDSYYERREISSLLP